MTFKKSGLFLLLVLFLAAACQPSTPEDTAKTVEEMTEAELDSFANVLAQRYIITDGHVDLPFRLQVSNFRLTREFIGIPVETDEGDFDYVRAKKGGLDAPFMSIYIPSSKGTGQEAYDFADELITMVNGIADSIPDKFQVVTSPAQVEANFKKGIISLPMGMENGSPIMDDINNVKYWHDRGIRYVTLTHSKDNQICDSSYDTTRTWNGLSPFGREVVAEMNKVGIMVDISHVSDSTFYQVMDITKVPVIASHSSCRKFTPDFERNMSDEMITRLGENGGVIQINFGSTFLDGKIQDYRNSKRDELRDLLAEKGLAYGDDGAQAVIDQFQEDNPTLYSDVEMVANHIDNVVANASIDNVGIGSDYDGVGDSLPTGLKDVSQYPNLIKELLKRGYSEEDIAKICYKNVFRVWSAVEAYAAQQ
ncbi:MAG: dipeptidase [Saprospiraceae bacterium]